MPKEGVLLLASVVGCGGFAGGVGLALLAWVVVSWWGSAGAPDDEPGHVNEAAQEAEARIAKVHRKAHEMLATSVLRGTGEQADFDDLLRDAGSGGGYGAGR